MAWRKQQKTLRTQEPKSSLGQASSDFCLHPDLIKAIELHTQKLPQESRSHRSTYITVYTERMGLPGAQIQRLA